MRRPRNGTHGGGEEGHTAWNDREGGGATSKEEGPREMRNGQRLAAGLVGEKKGGVRIKV